MTLKVIQYVLTKLQMCSLNSLDLFSMPKQAAHVNSGESCLRTLSQS